MKCSRVKQAANNSKAARKHSGDSAEEKDRDSKSERAKRRTAILDLEGAIRAWPKVSQLVEAVRAKLTSCSRGETGDDKDDES